MELPIAKESYQPSPDALVRAIKHRDLIHAQSTAEQTQVEAATLLSDPARPHALMSQLAGEVQIPQDMTARDVLDQIQDHYQQQGLTCGLIHSAQPRWPAELATVLEAAGYRPATRLVLLLSEYQPVEPSDAVQIVPARSVLGQLRAFFLAYARYEYRATGPAAEQLADTMFDQLDEPRLDLFVARMDGRVVASAGVLSLGQMGVIEPAFTHPQYRGQGIAGALMHHVIDHCHRAMFEQVLIDRSANCPATPFYESLGFQQAGSFVRYQPGRST